MLLVLALVARPARVAGWVVGPVMVAVPLAVPLALVAEVLRAVLLESAVNALNPTARPKVAWMSSFASTLT